MREFAILDGGKPEHPLVAYLLWDEDMRKFHANVPLNVDSSNLPLQFSESTVETNSIPSWAVEQWVEERIAPPSRQNIGQVLRAHDLEEYDPCKLLIENDGRSTQDDFYLKEIKQGEEISFQLGRAIAKARVQAGLTQAQLAKKVGTHQETISRLESGEANPKLSTIRSIAEALDVELEIALK